MGFWMTLSRHDAGRVEELLHHPDGAQAGRRRLWEAWNEGLDMNDEGESGSAHAPGGPPRLRFAEENNDIRRNWDGLHVLLTGCREHDRDEHATPCGRAPARDVVMGGLPLVEDGGGGIARIDTPRLLVPAEVHAVHAFLRTVDVHALIRERAGLVEEAGVYSFRMRVGQPDGSVRTMSMIEDGSLAESLEGVRGFYARAAAAGNAVVKEIS
ncbi:DUF1877 family protein [Streptomyces sp. NPDC059989]|uniref:DUF1877 family protein n=1 Tax=Streptomyces sp. NPDC059989 TaxID=3347026 RepID=UPI003695C1B1